MFAIAPTAYIRIAIQLRNVTFEAPRPVLVEYRKKASMILRIPK